MTEIIRILERGVWKEAKKCVVCGRLFTNRAKWKGKFEEVKYCSDKCRKNR